MQLELNRRSKVPMYRQLAAELREQIVSGAMAEGYRLPPERELSSRLEVNRTTVLQAYQQLKDEGLIASKVGKGTFVLAHGNELMKERARERIMDVFRQTVTAAKAADISLLDLLGMFEKAYREQS